ncbi:MAG TPA: GTP-binding protein [bacterium]|nr:GTP-binding protein [bacterium]
MKALDYRCAKCGNTQYETGEFRATGGFWTKVFDVQNKRFSTVTCSQCRYTEIYQADSSALGNIFDFFTG